MENVGICVCDTAGDYMDVFELPLSIAQPLVMGSDPREVADQLQNASVDASKAGLISASDALGFLQQVKALRRVQGSIRCSMM